MFYSVQRFFRQSGMPFSMAILALSVVGFLVFWLSSGSPGALATLGGLVFESSGWLRAPWSILTYGLITMHPWALLYVGLGMYYFAGTLERMWGSERFAWAFIGITVIAPICFLLAWMILGIPVTLASFAIPVTCCIVAWASLYPEQQVMLWFVIPLKGKYIGWIAAIATVVSYGYGAPALAIFAAVPIVIAWAYATGRLRTPSLPSRPRRGLSEDDYRGFDLDKRMQAEYERRKLRELFERSFEEDDDDDTEGKRSKP